MRGSVNLKPKLSASKLRGKGRRDERRRGKEEIDDHRLRKEKRGEWRRGK